MFLKSLELTNLLSFRETKVELRNLNVIIGPNGSGKSNLIECIGLLRALPSSLNSALLRGGGVAEWIWKGDRGTVGPAGITVCVERRPEDLEYGLRFASGTSAPLILAESLRTSTGTTYMQRTSPEAWIPSENSKPDVWQMSLNEAVFSVYRNPLDPTPITETGRKLGEIRIYREFLTGPMDQTRTGSSPSALKQSLDQDGSNLAVVLQEMDFQGTRPQVETRLQELGAQFERIVIRPDGGVLRLYLEEKQIGKVPASRLSDGTLKFLCLMAILYSHEPPPLVCIEEPENGLHPDALRVVASALKDASTRMQLIVTTHSEALVDALTDEPEAVLVCERDFDGGSQFKRLSSDRLSEWLETYTLGQLWMKGEIGGVA